MKITIKIVAIGFAVVSEAFGFIAVFLLNNSAGWILILIGVIAFFAGLFVKGED